ncbi:S-adenosyl-L-methionine-dependent methyltransferase [Xylariaceae sp. FL1272]|nr:S-adenosyl-L-methionine-dependent methyltransferase [Xylariaceae sp. FL1272]
MASTSRIVQLAHNISKAVDAIDKALKAKDLPTPSFDENAANLPVEVLEDVDTVVDATSELRDLLLDPMVMIHAHGGHNNSLCQQAIAHFGIASMVPSGGSVSFAHIADQTPLTEQMVGRLLRHAMTMNIFREPERGQVAHTKASKILVDPVTNNWLRTGTEEMWLASTKVLDALKKWPGSEELNQTGFCIANNTEKDVYTVLGSDLERAGRFGCALMAYSKKPEHDPKYITECYDWKSLGQVKVVYVAGGSGDYGIALAKSHDNLRIVVQDMAQMMGPGEDAVPDALRGRVTFEEHTLFQPQTEKSDVFYFRWSLRNWADKFCVGALQALVPGLQNGSRVIIQDIIMPEPHTGSTWRERVARSNDLSLAACFNSRDRTVQDWKDLLAAADPGFVFQKVIHPAGSALGILDFLWEAK